MGPKFQRALTKKHLITFLFMLNINSLVVQGFTLRSCRISFDTAICSQNNLREVPNDIPPRVKGIDLSNNKIQKLQVTNFTNLTALTELNLRHNAISNISKGTFSQLTSLERLILNRNQLVKLDDGIFDGLLNLKELLISYNHITTVGLNTFRALKKLTILDFSGNKLRSIAQVSLIIQHMPHLTDLYIQNIGISMFKSWELTNKSTELRLLDISDNPIKGFQMTANVFPNLTRLYIGNPSMKLIMTWDVPDKAVFAKVAVLDVSKVKMASNEEMRKLLSTFNSSLVTLRINAMQYRPTVLLNISCSIPTVSKLQLRQNKLSFIGSNLFTTCANITEIDLTNNKIKTIANNSFAPLPHLKILSLSHNKLASVPFATRNLPSLSELDLSFNLIQTLGCFDFTNLTNLQSLRLRWNQITALSDCAFQNLPKLRVLELQANGLAKIKNAFHTSLPSLHILRLNQNSLTTIKSGEFSGLPSLQNLSLFQNEISTLEKGCFAGLKNLQYLQLQNNQIKKDMLDKDCFKDLVNLRSLDMGNNHIKYVKSSPIKEPPFSHLSNLENLAFPAQHYRGKSQLPSNFLQGLTNLTTINFKNIQLISISEDFFVHTPKLDSLDMSANDLMDFPPNLFSPIPNLTKLRVTSTNLRSLDFLISANLKKLSFLQARKNAFSVISDDIIRSVPSLVYLDLQYNSFTCDCDNSAFLKWIENNGTQVFDAYNFNCYYPPHQKGTKLLDLNVKSCKVNVEFYLFISTTCVTLVMIVASFTYHFMRFQLAYAYYIFLAWLFDTKNLNKKVPMQYDAFVSYNVHDEAWVVRELLPHLEEQQGWKLCLHHRDFEPGRPIMENITDAIYGSRKTLCVISRRYLQSEWCSREMQVASFRLFDESKDVLILVFLEDIPTCHLSPYYRMRKLLKRQTYLSWPRAGQQANLFWEKLRQALTSTDTAAEDRLLLTVTDRQ